MEMMLRLVLDKKGQEERTKFRKRLEEELDKMDEDFFKALLGYEDGAIVEVEDSLLEEKK
jgi:hypothetical protein